MANRSPINSLQYLCGQYTYTFQRSVVRTFNSGKERFLRPMSPSEAADACDTFAKVSLAVVVPEICVGLLEGCGAIMTPSLRSHCASRCAVYHYGSAAAIREDDADNRV